MIIIGHRGAKGLAEENSLKAIKKALSVGVDKIEVDLRVHDNQLVLSHDQTLKSGTYCMLKDALKLVKGRVAFILEIKELSVIPDLVNMLEDYEGEYTISSKSYEVLRKIRQKLPNAPVAVIEKWSGVRAVAEASLLDTHEIHINHNWLWSGFVRSMKHRGYILYAYTVNTVERADELDSWGVDGIFTDKPHKFKKGDR